MSVDSVRTTRAYYPERRLDAPRVQQQRQVRADRFDGPRAAGAIDSRFADQIEAAFEENLGRAPTTDELRRFDELARKVQPDQVAAACKWVVCSGPEFQARTVFQEELQRPPTDVELNQAITFGNQMASEGRSPDEVRAAFVYTTRMGPEWQARAVAREELGRDLTPDEIAASVKWGNELMGQGKSTGEVRAAFVYCTRMGPEWQSRAVAREELGRDLTPEETAAAVKWGNELVAQGKSPGDVRAAFIYVTRMGPEWQSRSAYQDLLGRMPSADEQQKMTDWGKQLAAEGKSPSDVRAAFNWVIASTPEYQARRTPDRIREEIAQWALAQANDPNVGYSQTAGRFGDRVDGAGHRFYDCSGLVFSAYQQAGITLGGNWTGAMRSTWPNWADQIPKDTSQMKPGDLILMDGHVVMYTGNGNCVGAQSSHLGFADQVDPTVDAAHYLARGDAIVLRPHV